MSIRFVDICDLDALRAAVAEAQARLHRDGERFRIRCCASGRSIRSPRSRNEAGAALVVDNTFATPLLVRPLELGAHFSVHSVTKYLAGHGDVLGGVVVTDSEHARSLRALGRTIGPVLGPFESYLTMRGIKTFPLRMERQCANACRVASWLAAHPRVERVYFPGDPQHPDAATIRRLFPANALRRHGQLRAERRGQRRSLPLHGRVCR